MIVVEYDASPLSGLQDDEQTHTHTYKTLRDKTSFVVSLSRLRHEENMSSTRFGHAGSTIC